MKLRALAYVAAIALVGACSPNAGPTLSQGTPERSDLLVLRTRSGLGSLDLDTGAWRLRAPQAVASTDFSQVFAPYPRSGVTALKTWEPLVGTELAAIDIPGHFIPNVVSAGGDLVALTHPRGEGATPWLPDGRRNTELVIADPTGATKPRHLTLEGNLEPEAFSTDDDQLFMIEYLPALAPAHYSVRRVDLTTGKVSPINRLKLAAPGVMRGTGRTQVRAPEGDQLYTLYTQQGPNYIHGAPQDYEKGSVHAFVHVLNLRDAWAHCIDLPLPFGIGRATASAMAISPDGGSLYVSDWSKGVVAMVDPRDLKLMRTAKLELGSPDDETFAAVGDNDRLYLGGNREVVAVDTSTLRVVDRWRFGGRISGLAVASDDDRLHVALPHALVTLDTRDGSSVHRIRASGITAIEHVTQAGPDRAS